MCARRFLILVFFMTLLFVAGAFAIYQFGQDVLIRSATPKGHFEAPPATDSGPDYAQATNWIARPDMAAVDNPSLWVPSDAEPVAGGDKAAAAFFVHPTTYLDTAQWNAPIEPGGPTEMRSRLFVRSQSSAFADSADVWAPRYRQAAYGAFLLANRDAAQALDLAYRDVLKAFDHFVAAIPADRAIILAGHSQGSLHVLRLLADRREALKGRLVAAYVVGWPVSKTADLPDTGIAGCVEASSTACVLTFQSFAEPANPALILDAWEESPGRSGAHRRADIVCTDPISGRDKGQSAPADNPGTLVPDGDLANASIVGGQVGGRCDNGIFLLDGNIPKLGPFVLPGNNYHVYDYALFWGAIRRDAVRRLAAWQAR